MLYREGMPGVVLFSGICAVAYFVVGIRFDAVMIADTPTPIGEFAVLLMVLLFAGGMVWVYKKRWEPTRNIIGGSLGVLLVAYLISEYVVPFNLVWCSGALCTCCRVSCLSFFKRAPFILFSDWAVCFGFDRFPLLQRLLLQ